MEKKYVVVKITHNDFNCECFILGVSSDIEVAKSAFRSAVVTEKENQEKFGYQYDTEDETETSYSAYNEGYEATDSISIYVQETHEIEKNS